MIEEAGRADSFVPARRGCATLVSMPRIEWVDDAEAGGDLARLFELFRARSATGAVPPILRTMSQRPDFLAAVDEASQVLHFTDGALTRAEHEMIASYVAALNRCHY